MNHIDETLRIIDGALELYQVIDTQSHIEETAWAEMDEAIKMGYISREEGEFEYYKWFRNERGLPVET